MSIPLEFDDGTAANAFQGFEEAHKALIDIVQATNATGVADPGCDDQDAIRTLVVRADEFCMAWVGAVFSRHNVYSQPPRPELRWTNTDNWVYAALLIDWDTTGDGGEALEVGIQWVEAVARTARISEALAQDESQVEWLAPADAIAAIRTVHGLIDLIERRQSRP